MKRMTMIVFVVCVLATSLMGCARQFNTVKESRNGVQDISEQNNQKSVSFNFYDVSNADVQNPGSATGSSYTLPSTFSEHARARRDAYLLFRNINNSTTKIEDSADIQANLQKKMKMMLDSGIMYSDELCNDWFDAQFKLQKGFEEAKGDFNIISNLTTSAMGLVKATSNSVAGFGIFSGAVNSTLDTTKNFSLSSADSVNTLAKKVKDARRKMASSVSDQCKNSTDYYAINSALNTYHSTCKPLEVSLYVQKSIDAVDLNVDLTGDKNKTDALEMKAEVNKTASSVKPSDPGSAVAEAATKVVGKTVKIGNISAESSGAENPSKLIKEAKTLQEQAVLLNDKSSESAKAKVVEGIKALSESVNKSVKDITSQPTPSSVIGIKVEPKSSNP